MTMEKPRVVTAEEWEKERAELLVAEKEATRALDAIAVHQQRARARAHRAGRA